MSQIFPIFKNLVENQLTFKIKTLYFDNGGEFIKLSTFLQQHGISHLTTPPYTLEHNGLSERKHRHVVETARCLLHHASLPLHFWSYAFQTAAYLINRMPTPGLHTKAPFETLFRCSLNYSKLKVFGCLCFPWLTPYAHNKLQPKSQPCVFLGYSPNQSAYICFNPKTSKIYTSCHVEFIEDQFPYSSKPTPHQTRAQDSNSILSPPTFVVTNQSITTHHNSSTNTLASDTPISHSHSLYHLPENSPPPSPQNTSSPNLIPQSSSSSSLTSNPQALYTKSSSTSVAAESSHVPATSLHRMTTRSQNGVFKPKKQLYLATKFPLPEPVEPSCITQAMKHPQWQAAMSAEFNALLSNGTWDLIPKQPHFNIIGNKWIFRIKRNINGSIARYKAHLAAKGFHQRPGIDYSETYSPVIKPQTIKVVLCLAISHGWSLCQMDVNNAFLHGAIDEDIYMTQPVGFVHSQYPNHVCKLKKALYGLKQAPRAWYHVLKNFLIDYGFTNSKSDTSLFVYHNGNVLAYFLIYVDDLLLTGNNIPFINSFKSSLAQQFSLKDLGTPSHFLGMEITPMSHGLFLSQHHYV